MHMDGQKNINMHSVGMQMQLTGNKEISIIFKSDFCMERLVEIQQDKPKLHDFRWNGCLVCTPLGTPKHGWDGDIQMDLKYNLRFWTNSPNSGHGPVLWGLVNMVIDSEQLSASQQKVRYM